MIAPSNVAPPESLTPSKLTESLPMLTPFGELILNGLPRPVLTNKNRSPSTSTNGGRLLVLATARRMLPDLPWQYTSVGDSVCFFPATDNVSFEDVGSLLGSAEGVCSGVGDSAELAASDGSGELAAELAAGGALTGVDDDAGTSASDEQAPSRTTGASASEERSLTVGRER